MKTNYLFLLTTCLAIITSCGPSAEQIEKEETIAKNAAALTEFKITERTRLKSLIDSLTEQIQNTEIIISSAENELKVERVKYEDLKTFKFMRTAKEKEAQLFAQLQAITFAENAQKYRKEELTKIKTEKRNAEAEIIAYK